MLAFGERPEGRAGCGAGNRRRTCGNVGIARAISKRGGKDGKPAFGFPGFPGRGISIMSLRCAERCFGSPAAGAALQHMAVMQQPVQHRTDRCGVTEQLAPVLNRTIGRQQCARSLIAAHHDFQ